MPDLTLKNIDVTVLDALKERAARNGRTLNSEILTVLANATSNKHTSELETARKIRSKLSIREQTNSTELLRRDRHR